MSTWKTPSGVTEEFEFCVSQNSPIKYKKLTAPGAGRASFGESGFYGAEALVHFDADQFADGIVRIDVLTSGAHVVSRTFDLDNLK